MRVLVVNAGSSTIKLRLLMPTMRCSANASSRLRSDGWTRRPYGKRLTMARSVRPAPSLFSLSATIWRSEFEWSAGAKMARGGPHRVVPAGLSASSTQASISTARSNTWACAAVRLLSGFAVPIFATVGFIIGFAISGQG